MLQWHKQGMIFQPDGNFGWMNSHAQIPTVLVLEDRLRVYFATRQRRDFGLTTFLDLDKKDPHKILYIHDKPILEVGKPGTFDHHGIFPTYAKLQDDKVYLYYMGWYRGTSIPYHNAVGLAVSEDNGKTFRKLFEGPILDRSATEPYSTGSLCLVEKNDIYHMFYTEIFDWLYINERYEPLYHIKHAISKDGIEWTKTGKTVIERNSSKEALARAAIIHKDETYHMWFCYRGSDDFRDGADSYRIGYASSTDLVNWTRQDELAGIDVSATGWDSTMVTYPCVVQVENQLYMFYNGNGFGTSGFGLATASW